MKKITIEYNSYTDTVRIQPANYCLIFRYGGIWTLYNDWGAPAEIMHKALDFIRITGNSFIKDGNEFASKLNTYINQ